MLLAVVLFASCHLSVGSSHGQERTPTLITVRFAVYDIPKGVELKISATKARVKVGKEPKEMRTGIFVLEDEALLAELAELANEKRVVAIGNPSIRTLDGTKGSLYWESRGTDAAEGFLGTGGSKTEFYATPKLRPDGTISLPLGGIKLVGCPGLRTNQVLWSFEEAETLSENQRIMVLVPYKALDGTVRRLVVAAQASAGGA